MERQQQQTAYKDPHTILRAALSDLVTAGLDAFTQWLQHQPAVVDDDVAGETIESDDAATTAADLLGVSIGANADAVRAAFRASVKERVATGAFHDQRGAATDRQAQELIDAKNLLIERSRKEQTHAA